MLCLSDDSFSSNDVEQLISFYAPALTALLFLILILILFLYLFIFIFSSSEFILNVNGYYVCT